MCLMILIQRRKGNNPLSNSFIRWKISLPLQICPTNGLQCPDYVTQHVTMFRDNPIYSAA